MKIAVGLKGIDLDDCTLWNLVHGTVGMVFAC